MSANDLREAIAEMREQIGAMQSALNEIRDIVANTHKPLLTVREAGDLVGRAPYTIRSWIGEGRLSATRINGSGPRGRLMIRREDLLRMFECWQKDDRK